MLPSSVLWVPLRGPGLDSRAGKSEGFWLVSDQINQGENLVQFPPALSFSWGLQLSH